MTSCLILGAGINGLLSALLLRQAGLEVQVLERGQAGRESSWAGAGILSLLLPWHYGEEVVALGQRGRKLWPALAARLQDESGIDPEFRRCGMLVLGEEAPDGARRWCAEQGEPVSGTPSFGSDLALEADAGLWLPEVAQARNPRVMQALRGAAVRAGVVIREQSPALRLQVAGQRVVEVETPSGMVTADSVVVTAGAWSGKMLAALGKAPPIAPVRGQILLFKAAPGLLPCVVYRRGMYLVPRADGHILAGSTLEEVGFDKSTTPAAHQALLDFAYSLLPALREAEIVTQWSGLRPGSPGNVPTIARHPVLENLYANIGHFRYGVTMAPAAAEVLLQVMLGTPAGVAGAAYGWG